MDVFNDLAAIGGISTYKASDDRAWAEVSCPHCDSRQMAVVAARGEPGLAEVRWLRCVTCRKGAVENFGQIAPATMPMRVPAGLPDTEAAIWDEARTCLGVGAYHATVMLCRKFLFHVAVSHKLDPKNEKGWAPSYAQAVEYLEAEGIVTKKMRSWVDRIKGVGNDANHEISPVSAGQAQDVATFTEQLLVLAYEMDALMGEPELAE